MVVIVIIPSSYECWEKQKEMDNSGQVLTLPNAGHMVNSKISYCCYYVLMVPDLQWFMMVQK